MEKTNKIVKGKNLSLGEEKAMFEDAARIGLIADVEQNPGYGPAADTLVPTLVGHGLLHHYRAKRPLIALEHLVAMGYPIFTRLHNREFPLLNHLKNLTDNNIKKLAGNAMYLPLMGLQLAYLVANIKKSTVDDSAETPAKKVLRRSSWSFSDGHGMRGSPGFSSPEMVGVGAGAEAALPSSGHATSSDAPAPMHLDTDLMTPPRASASTLQRARHL